MKKLKNISDKQYKLQGRYSWAPGETLEVTDDLAEHVLDAQAGRFEVVPDDEKKTSNRKQSAFRRRSK